MTGFVRWLPWALVAGAIGLFLAVSPAGPILATVWLVVVVVERGIVLSLDPRNARVLTGFLFAALCFLAAFEGGWYMIPAAAAFLISDWRERTHPSVRPLGGARLEIAAGVGSAIVGWSALALIVWGPLYSARTSTVGPDGVIDSAAYSLSLAAVGITDRAAVFLLITAVLLAVVAASALIHARLGFEWAHWAIAVASLALAGVVIIGLLSIGAWLLPALVLAILAWWAGRTDQLSATRGSHAG